MNALIIKFYKVSVENLIMEKKERIKRDTSKYSYVSLMIPKELKEKLDEYVLEKHISLTRFFTNAAELAVNGESNPQIYRDKTLPQGMYVSDTSPDYTAVSLESKELLETVNAKMDLLIKLLAK